MTPTLTKSFGCIRHACSHRPQVTFENGRAAVGSQSRAGRRYAHPLVGFHAVCGLHPAPLQAVSPLPRRESKGPANCAARCPNFRLRSALPISASSEICKTGSAQHLRRSVWRLPSFFLSAPLVGQPQPPIWDPGLAPDPSWESAARPANSRTLAPLRLSPSLRHPRPVVRSSRY